MKNILLIATGGTIASKNTEYGLAPSITSEEIIEFVPDIEKLCKISTIQLMNVDSSNMDCNCWLKMAQCIEENYDKYDGFLITHGTDTLAYTSAALSYLIQNSRKPIVLTGSQKSIYLKDTDARKNLYEAFLFACDEKANGVHIVFNSNIILGTRARKTKTHSYNAFDSIDYPLIGVILNEKVIYYINEQMNKPVKFYRKLNRNINIIKLVPGIKSEILEFVGKASDVLIIEGFGTGGLPCYDEEDSLKKVIKSLIKDGKIIIFSTSVPYEGSNIGVYQVGNKIKADLNILESYNMTTESLVTKMMWITAITKDRKEIEEMFYSPIAHDIVF